MKAKFNFISISLENRFLFLALFFFFWSNYSHSRHSTKLYDWSLGLRLGYPTAVSIKHYVKPNFSLEGITAFQRQNQKASWVQIALAAQYNMPINNSRNFNWFLGTGLSVYRWNWSQGFNGEANPKTVFGTFVQLGFDYKFKKVPINLSLDWMPYYQFTGYNNGLTITGGAASIRYVFQ